MSSSRCHNLKSVPSYRPQVLVNRLSTFPLSLFALTLKSTSTLLSPPHTVVDALVALSASVLLLPRVMLMVMMTTTSKQLAYVALFGTARCRGFSCISGWPIWYKNFPLSLLLYALYDSGL